MSRLKLRRIEASVSSLRGQKVNLSPGFDGQFPSMQDMIADEIKLKTFLARFYGS